MATNIAEALQGAGAVSAKPVTMEAIPEATIDVGGGSQSLDIEGLGVKRRKDDLSVATASTSQVAIEDLFGDLLDEVNFSDPSSVDAFRESAASRINEFDSNTFSSILGEASTVASDLATFTSQFQDRPQPQQQFEQVFGPPSVTSGDDAGDIGLDTATSTEAQDISDLTNPGLAAGLVGGAFGAFGPGAGFSGLASNIASGALSSTGVAGVFGGVSAAQSLADAKIESLPDALGATATALSLGQQAANVADLANKNVTVSGLISQATKNVGEYIEGIYTAITNPDQTLEAYGRQMQYGTLTPQVFTFNLPSGVVGFNFDKQTGQLVTPGFVEALMPAPIKAFYNVSQFALDKLGYNEAVSDRAIGMANAFSTAGVSFSAPTASSAGMTGFADPSDQSNVTAVDLDFSEVPGAIGSLQFDMNALADQVAGKGVTADNISIEDINQAAVVQSYLDYEDIDIADAAIQSTFNSYATSRGIDNSIESIAERAGIESMAASKAFAEDYNAIAEAMGVQGIDLGFGSLADRGMTGLEVSTAAASLSAAVASQVQDLQGAGSTSIAAAVRGYNPSITGVFDTPTPAGIQSLTEEAKLAAEAYYGKKEEEERIALANAESDFEAVFALGYDDGGYNSPNPTNKSVEIAEQVMSITGKNQVDFTDPEQQRLAKMINRNLKGLDPDPESVGGTMDDFGYGPTAGKIGSGGVDAPAYEAAGAMAAMDAPEIDFGEGKFDESDTGIGPSASPSTSSTTSYSTAQDQPGYDDMTAEDQAAAEAEAAGIDTAGIAAGVESYDIGFGSEGSESESGDSTVICTALKDMGLLHKELWQHDGAYGRTLPLETRQGYWAWGVPTAKFIRKNRWAAKAIRPVVTEVAKEMAHRVGYGKGSKLGAALLYVGLPMCRVISRIKNNGNNTGSVYS